MSINTLIGKAREKYSGSRDDTTDDSWKRAFFEEKILPHYKGLYYYSLMNDINRNPAISRLCGPTKIKKTYHITQNAVRADNRAAFLRGGTGRRR